MECLALLDQVVLVLFGLGHSTRLQPLKAHLYQVFSQLHLAQNLQTPQVNQKLLHLLIPFPIRRRRIPFSPLPLGRLEQDQALVDLSDEILRHIADRFVQGLHSTGFKADTEVGKQEKHQTECSST